MCSFLPWYYRRDAAAQAPHRVADAIGSKAVTVADLDLNKLDATGEQVTAFFGRKPPDFAVYQTRTRISVQFADDKTEADRQRKAMATLNPIRGEINGLIDGWRLKVGSQRFRKAARFDRRVGDALVVAFEDDVPDAGLILARIKQDILDERIAVARFEYLIAAFVVAIAAIVLAALAGWSDKDLNKGLWSASAAGTVGAFFSIAIGIRSRTVLPDLLVLANTMDAILRMIIGMIGAAVLFALLDLHLVNLSLGSTALDPTPSANKWLMVVVIGFIAGFSERLVPDILATAVAKPADPPPPRRDADRQPAAGRKQDGGTPNTTAGKAEDDVDPAPDQADIDHCACDIHLPDAEATRDEDLPAASGGVAIPAKP